MSSKEYKHEHSGRISAINESHDGKHVNVEVVHGKRRRRDDAKDSPLVGYDRPTSRMAMPKGHAKGLSIGDRVHVGLTPHPAEDPFSDDDQDDGEQQQAPARKKGGKLRLVGGNKGGKKAAAKRKSGRGGSSRSGGGTVGAVMTGGADAAY